jgi:hypothetical protein
MLYDGVRKGLKDARASGQPWHVLAGILRRGLNSPESGTHSNIWRLAARETGLSEVMLRRYLLALERLEAIERDRGMPPGHLLSGGFAPIELTLRLHSRDPQQGLEALEELKQRKITLRDVRTRLEKTDGSGSDGTAARGAALRDRGVLVGRCEGLVSAESAGLFGEGTATSRRSSARYLRRVGFEFRNEVGRILGGADLYLSESGGRDPLETLAQSVVLAAHLPAFYLIVGPDLDEEDAERAVAVLDVLGGRPIGVLLLRDDPPAVLVRPAEVITVAGGSPDRYGEILKQLATGRSTARE